MKTLGLLVLLALVEAGAAPTPPSDITKWMADYCVGCHNAQRKIGGLVLTGFNAAKPEQNAEVAEKIILKLRAGMMPPPGSNRPANESVKSIVESLETAIDLAAASRPYSGWRPFQRLNRAEYARAIRDLLALDVDVATFLPADTVSDGFDNVADVQTFSPILMTAYLRGASQISRLALADPASAKRIFLCRPRTPAEEKPCATQIIRNLTAQAFRGTEAPQDVDDALAFFAQGRKAGKFEDGVRLALQSILMSPRFLFRLEPPPASVNQISQQSLASRLSYFIWGAAPDAQLLKAAASGTLQSTLEAQARRLLNDKNANALATRFAVQWLRLQDLEKAVPDDVLFPKFNAALASAMRTETTLFVESVFRDNRSVLDLFSADYSFLNEPLARHYGIPNVTGPAFRRVAMPVERRGLLGQGSILLSTSLADRTSPVLRGKWVLDVLFGTPPPPPPPNVPSLDETARAVRNGKTFSTRQRIEQHRRNPACNSCHRVIDPLGIALENFDVTGAWRTVDNQIPVDALGELYDGTPMQGPAGLRKAVLDHQDLVLRNFAERMLTYAVGRRLEPADMPAVRSIVHQAAKNNYTASSFVLAVVNSAAFQMSQPPAPKGLW